MATLLQMPKSVADQITFALVPLGDLQCYHSDRTVIYTLHYDTGLTLSVHMACIEQRRMILFKRSHLRVSVFEHLNGKKRSRHQLTDYLPLPQSSTDIMFSITLMSKFTSMSRAVADVLGAGECISIG